MPKAIISNRVYLDVTPEIKAHLIKVLTYKIELKGATRGKIKHYEIIKNYKIVSDTIMSIPQGRTDLIPEGYIVTDKRVLEPVPFPNPKLELREDQEKVINETNESGIINAAPGWGKTFAALHLARKLGQKTLVITHTTALRDQWMEEVQLLYGMDVGVIGSGKYDIDHAITIGNVQSVVKYIKELSKEFGTIILDEMHHVSATTFSSIVDSSYAKYRIGLSGTLLRTDGKHVIFKDYFGDKIHQPPLANTLAPTIRLMKTGRSLLQVGTWVQKVNDLLYDKDYQEFIAAAAIAQINKGHKVLITADRVEFLQKIGGLIGSRCLCITGGSSTFEERKEQINKIYTGEADCIAGSRQIFSEGLSVNPLSCLIIASPTANPIGLEQTIGRIMRMYDGKLDPVVLDPVFTGPDGRKQIKARLAFYMQKGWEVIE